MELITEYILVQHLDQAIPFQRLIALEINVS